MSESDSFPCPSCNTTYRRGSLEIGARVKCRRCGEIITVPPDEYEALEDVIEAPDEAPRRSASRAGARTAARAGAASRRSRARPGQSERDKKAPTMLFVSLGAMVLIAGGIWFATKGSDDNGKGDSSKETTSTNPGENGNATNAGTAKAAVAKKPTRRELYDAALAAADASADKDEKTAKLLEAIVLIERGGLGDDALSKVQLHEKILEHDPDHKPSRLALGFVHYSGDHPEYSGKWVTRDDYARITAEWQKLEIANEKAEAEKKERERWETPFGRKAKRVADYYTNDVKNVPDVDLRFYLGTEKIPNPYLLMVQEAQTPDPTATAELIGPGLAALRKQFRNAYAEDTLPSWDDSEYVVPVMVFKDQKSYERYRDNGHKFFPSTGLAAAFYTSGVDERISDVCRGTLYVWQGASESKFYHELFHEATHQIMHNAAMLPRMPPTPWLQEGIAEFWGSYEGNQYAGYKFRRVLASRMGTISQAAEDYYKQKALENAGKAKEDAPRTFLTPKFFLGIDQIRFARAKQAIEAKEASSEDSLIVNSVYALGWAWIFYSHFGPAKASLGKPGKYAKAFEDVLGIELKYRYNRNRLAAAYGIESDEDWDEITDDFFLFCKRKLRRYVSGDLEVPDLNKPR